MSLVDDLRAARALIDTPEKWGKGPDHWGYDRKCAQEALCFRGPEPFAAVERALPLWFKARQMLTGRWSVLDSANIIRFNDLPRTTHADIMALFDRAIDAALAKAQPPLKE